MLKSILSGAWDALSPKESGKAVGYWWGMNTGVLDVQLSPELPDGVHRLGEILRGGIINGAIDPFRAVLRDRQGNIHNDGERWMTPEEIMHMDWLCDCVDGEIPGFDALKPMAQDVVRVLGVYRDQIPPEKEGVLL